MTVQQTLSRTAIVRLLGVCLLGAFVLASLADFPSAQAAVVSWDNGGVAGVWGAPQGVANNNWSADVTPSTGDDVDITTGDTVNYTTALYGVGMELIRLDVSGSSSVLNISADMNISDAANTVFAVSSSATVNHTAGTLTLTNNGGDNSFLTNGTYNLLGGSLVHNGRFNLNGGAAALNVSSGSLSIAGNGNALRIQNGTINYTGGSISLTGAGAVRVEANGRLFIFNGGGTGLNLTMGGAANSDFNNFGTLRVIGDSTVDTITSIDDLLLNSSGTYDVIVNSTTDQFLSVDGDIFIDGTLTVANLTGSDFGTFDILTATGGGLISGAFSSFTPPTGWSVLDDGSIDGTFTIGQIATASVPEPGSLGLMMIAMGMVGTCRLNRRRRS